MGLLLKGVGCCVYRFCLGCWFFVCSCVALLLFGGFGLGLGFVVVGCVVGGLRVCCDFLSIFPFFKV